jgi:hypothetical protein
VSACKDWACAAQQSMAKLWQVDRQAGWVGVGKVPVNSAYLQHVHQAVTGTGAD